MQVPCTSQEPPERLAGNPAPIMWQPRFDLRVGERDVIAFLDVPGVDEDELHIEVLPHALMVEGDRAFDHDLEDAEEFTTIGRPYGFFRVEIPFSASVDPEGATAKYRRGVLRVRIPLAQSPTVGRRVHL